MINLASDSPLVIFSKDIDTSSSPAKVTLISTDKADSIDPKNIVIRAIQANIASTDSESFEVAFQDPCL